VSLSELRAIALAMWAAVVLAVAVLLAWDVTGSLAAGVIIPVSVAGAGLWWRQVRRKSGQRVMCPAARTSNEKETPVADAVKTRCPVKIRYGVSAGTHTQCDQDADHLQAGDADTHEGPGLPEFPYQRIIWYPGDRREYTGEWPGPCDKVPGCILHLGHHGRCAP
jgi:hypothetical protein